MIVNNDDDESDEPLASSPAKRLRRGKEKETSPAPHTPRHISKQARLDIAEDLEDLQDSGKRPMPPLTCLNMLILTMHSGQEKSNSWPECRIRPRQKDEAS